MAKLLPPMPVGVPPGHSFWNDWYEKMRTIINNVSSTFTWDNLLNKPTTIAGFGITDAYTKTEVDTIASSKEDSLGAGTTSQFLRGDKVWTTLTKAMVGLGNVDNTSDLSKPISTLTQAALDTKAPVAQQAWQTPSYSNGWTDFGAEFGVVGYYKDSFGVVHLRGIIKSGTINTTAFTLPSGYLPNANELFATASDAGYSVLLITSSGAVKPFSGGNTWFSLSNISFRT